MNFNYYDEILQNIEDLYNEGDYKKADILLENELNMPYVPKDVYESLVKLKDKYRHLDDTNLVLDDELIEEYLLNGNSFKEFMAIDYLKKMHLANYEDIIQKYLLEDKDENAKAYLISIMIDQGLNKEYKVIKNNMEYDFIPLYCEKLEHMDGVIDGYEFIDNSIGINDVSIANMAKKLLAKIAFNNLPLSLDSEEGLMYTKSIIVYLLELFEDNAQKDEFYSQFVEENDIILKREKLEEIVELLK